MPSITYVQTNGASTTIEAAEGVSVMQAAVSHGVSGILADCGGAASCATCHVYVDATWIDRLPSIEPDEDEMLDCTASSRKPASRLSCQIEVTPELDGLTVQVPETQS